MMLDGAQRSICCSSLKTNKKQILRSAQHDMLGGFFSSLLGDSIHRQNGAVLHTGACSRRFLGSRCAAASPWPIFPPAAGRLSMARPTIEDRHIYPALSDDRDWLL